MYIAGEQEFNEVASQIENRSKHLTYSNYREVVESLEYQCRNSYYELFVDKLSNKDEVLLNINLANRILNEKESDILDEDELIERSKDILTDMYSDNQLYDMDLKEINWSALIKDEVDVGMVLDLENGEEKRYIFYPEDKIEEALIDFDTLPDDLVIDREELKDLLEALDQADLSNYEELFEDEKLKVAYILNRDVPLNNLKELADIYTNMGGLDLSKPSYTQWNEQKVYEYATGENHVASCFTELEGKHFIVKETLSCDDEHRELMIDTAYDVLSPKMLDLHFIREIIDEDRFNIDRMAYRDTRLEGLTWQNKEEALGRIDALIAAEELRAGFDKKSTQIIQSNILK